MNERRVAFLSLALRKDASSLYSSIMRFIITHRCAPFIQPRLCWPRRGNIRRRRRPAENKEKKQKRENKSQITMRFVTFCCLVYISSMKWQTPTRIVRQTNTHRMGFCRHSAGFHHSPRILNNMKKKERERKRRTSNIIYIQKTKQIKSRNNLSDCQVQKEVANLFKKKKIKKTYRTYP